MYNDHPRGPNIVVVVNRWSLFEVTYVIKVPNRSTKWWSLKTGCHNAERVVGSGFSILWIWLPTCIIIKYQKWTCLQVWHSFLMYTFLKGSNILWLIRLQFRIIDPFIDPSGKKNLCTWENIYCDNEHKKKSLSLTRCGYIAGWTICWTTWGCAGAVAGGAVGNNSSVAGGFAQNFFQIQNVSKIPRAKKRIISRGDEKSQCFDWKGIWMFDLRIVS